VQLLLPPSPTVVGGFKLTKMAGTVVAIAILLRLRNPKLGLIALVIDAILKSGGASKLTFARLAQMVSLSSTIPYPHESGLVHSEPYSEGDSEGDSQ
jgi:hypothetical protein